MRITVFTPVYNRGDLLQRLYLSLKRQTFTDFEWIVINDGSTDNTEEVMQKIIHDEKTFLIQYVSTQNGGKHRAINLGVQRAKGELFCIVDSDDYLTKDALVWIDQVEASIPQERKKAFGGICGLKGFSEESIIGKTFDGYILDITMLERIQYGITGDKAEVFYTEILRKYPFPEFEQETFITECVVWDRIASDGYLLRFFNQIIEVCNYLSDGLTAQGETLLLRNPRGYGLYLSQCAKIGKISGIKKWNTFLQFYYNLRGEYSIFKIGKFLNINPVLFWCQMFGLRLFYKLYDR